MRFLSLQCVRAIISGPTSRRHTGSLEFSNDGLVLYRKPTGAAERRVDAILPGPPLDIPPHITGFDRFFGERDVVHFDYDGTYTLKGHQSNEIPVSSSISANRMTLR